MNKKMIFIPFFFVGMAALVIWVVMLLWNWLIPDIIGWSSLTYWQAAGLLLLSKILFGGFGGGKSKGNCNGKKHHRGWKHKFKNKWMDMSEEDKRRWEAKFKGTPYCGERLEEDNSKLNQKNDQEE